MNKTKLDEKGLTLVELLAVVILTGIVSILVFSITTKALENTRIISQETMLRDEADIIVSKFIKEMYSTKQEHIIRYKEEVIIDPISNKKSYKYSYLEVIENESKCQRDENGDYKIEGECKLKDIGFKTVNGVTKIQIFNEQYTVSNSSIKVLAESKINGTPNETSVYEIVLKLKFTHVRGNKETERIMSFKNEIQPIVNSK
ncbi:hypothetical protein H9635_15965 [Solibacillus sp. A46]|uniref:Prepilin-type N-terminal cleavage/methylation domain-containing protein n=1 Tax=Solibacillus faecavium TaxID=2762221 RepID=A0ABR8Y212_9BACL|nr:hypothetical protein [Solibacillus faecavium]